MDELPHGKPVIKLAGLRPIALLKLDDRVYAFEAFCPHSKWNLGASGKVITNNGHVYLFCMGHAGMWSLETGEGKVQGREAPKLKRYAVSVVNGYVYVDLSKTEERHQGAPIKSATMG
ncbi:Rieske (2Fe-2S) domain protein [Pyrobaculum ferrireducens]|uniref:Rieske (2Fe-2S) domain protein n=1 Tax=Pyrobaculum ferrireducens TaxID=1104324 RepID=G7VHJ9_9CREN|nr:Rieske (2Fe-2S) domain protein [Pyrobaculum ferrireducens]